MYVFRTLVSFSGKYWRKIDFQVIYPKTIHGDSSLRTDDSLEEAIVHEDPFLQMYLYDTNGQLLQLRRQRKKTTIIVNCII